MKKSIFGVLLALTILFIYRSFAFAAPEAFQVSPVIEEISITPGVATSYDLTITNTSDRPLGIHADVTTFQTPDEGTEDTLTPSPLISWIEVTPTDTIIASHEQKTLKVTITPPKDLSKGGYYCAIFLTPFVSKTQDPHAPIVLTRVGTLVLAQYGKTDFTNLKGKVSLLNVGFSRLFLEASPFDFHFTVKNSYFTHFTAKPFLTLTPLFGKPERITLSEKHILPGKSKVWQETVKPSSFSLFYTGELAVSVGGGHYISQKIYLVVIPGLHYILLGIILLFLGFVATYHKRVRKAVKIFITGQA